MTRRAGGFQSDANKAVTPCAAGNHVHQRKTWRVKVEPSVEGLQDGHGISETNNVKKTNMIMAAKR
jgi:hypothetical protein